MMLLVLLLEIQLFGFHSESLQILSPLLSFSLFILQFDAVRFERRRPVKPDLIQLLDSLGRHRAFLPHPPLLVNPVSQASEVSLSDHVAVSIHKLELLEFAVTV